MRASIRIRTTMTFTAAVLTVSDRGARGERVDTAGPAAVELLAAAGITTVASEVIEDDREAISRQLVRWASEDIDLVLTTGGTGLASRDVTPEATLDVAERLVPGLAEVMRDAGRRSTHLAALSRAVAVVRARTLIVNLPGSEKGARESLQAILELLPHALELLAGDAREEHPTDKL